MKRLNWEIQINAPIQKVFDSVINSEKYKEWTKPFASDSHFIGEWKEGETLRFLTASGEDGKMMGALARVAEIKTPEYISLEHFGVVINGEDMTDGPEVDGMVPSYENYILTEKDGTTTFKVEQDLPEKYVKMLNEMWPNALKALKEVCEKS